MDRAALAATLPDADAGAPAWLVAVVILAMSAGVGWWFTRLSRSGSGDGKPARARRSQEHTAVTETDEVSATHAVAPVPVAPSTGRVEPVIAAVPEVSEDGRSVEDRLADLDSALRAGSLTPDEHRVLRSALLEGFPDSWTGPRPGPVPPPTE